MTSPDHGSAGSGGSREATLLPDPVDAPRRVALTFDAEHPDRPTEPGVDARLIALLRETRVPATFFIQGRWAEAYPGLVRQIRDGGHLIGSHSFYHARLPLLSDEGLAVDIADAEAAILAASGVDPRPWFRCPFGAGMDDARIREAIAAAGYRHVAWNVVGEDWDPARAPADVEATVVDGAAHHGDGTVVLLHAWPDRTLAALPAIIARLRASGHRFVRVDDLPDVPSLGESVDADGTTE